VLLYLLAAGRRIFHKFSAAKRSCCGSARLAAGARLLGAPEKGRVFYFKKKEKKKKANNI